MSSFAEKLTDPETEHIEGVLYLVPPSEAFDFIEALTGDALSPVTFQTFDDKKAGAVKAAHLTGTLIEHAAKLWNLSKAGAGIYVTVNETDGKGRRAENVIALRALFVDYDSEKLNLPEPTCPLEPSFRVKTGRGWHLYWTLRQGEPLHAFEAAQKKLQAYYGTDSVFDLPRVLRVPGFPHLKGEPRAVTFLEGSGRAYSVEEVIGAHSTGKTFTPVNYGDGGLNNAMFLWATNNADGILTKHPDISREEFVGLAQEYSATKTEDGEPLPESDRAISDLWDRFQAGKLDVKPGLPARDPMEGVTRMSDVEPERVSWFWYGRVPVGGLTVIDGDPGLGKSTICIDLIARLSRGGTMPEDDAEHAPAATVLLAAEDHAAMTIAPRLIAAKADRTKVYKLNAVRRPGTKALEWIDLSQDIDRVRETVRTVGARLVVIDPLTAYLGMKVDSHKDQEIRTVLGKLTEMAEQESVAVILLRHLNKSTGGSALYRGIGSIAIAASARSVLVVGKDKDDDERVILAQSKTNLGPMSPALAYRIVQAPGSFEVSRVKLGRRDRVQRGPSGSGDQGSDEDGAGRGSSAARACDGSEEVERDRAAFTRRWDLAGHLEAREEASRGRGGTDRRRLDAHPAEVRPGVISRGSEGHPGESCTSALLTPPRGH